MILKKRKLVCGVGVNDYNGNMSVNGRAIKSYAIWHAMIERCYSFKKQLKMPTYIGCSVCDEWLYFSNFKEWYDANYKENFELDKDILIKGNKIYSPETCRYVPKYINQLLVYSNRTHKDLPLGISQSSSGKGYEMQCNNGYGKNIQHHHKTIEAAVADYSVTKKKVVKQQAVRAFLDNSIKTDIYLALIRREF